MLIKICEYSKKIGAINDFKCSRFLHSQDMVKVLTQYRSIKSVCTLPSGKLPKIIKRDYITIRLLEGKI